MSLLPVATKQQIKRAARCVGLLRFANRVEYAYGNRITRAGLNLYRSFVAPGSLCFDIGAHYGGKTRLFRQLGARVLAVEPLEECCRLIRLKFGDDGRVTLFAGACGEVERTATLHRSSLNPQNSTLSDDFGGGSDSEWEECDQIAVTTLDRLIEQHGRPAFCKIDTEGYEFDVLKGLSVTIPALSFEFHANDLASTEKCFQRLGALGYREFNYTCEPTEEFIAAEWLSAAALLARLGESDLEASGNVFARANVNNCSQRR